MGLVLLAFHWEWRDKSEVKHDLPELSEIERRMTNVQDVMIGLSEKIDRVDMV